MLQKGAHLHKDMGYFKKYKGTLLPEQERFHNNLNIGDITVNNYQHAKGV